MSSSRDSKGRPLFKPMKAGRVVTSVPYIDSHIHIDSVVKAATCNDTVSMEEFKKLCVDSGILGEGFSGAVQVCMAPDSIENTKQLQKLYPAIIHPAWGVHPHNASQWTDDLGRDLAELVSDDHSVAWGECGLDYFYDLSPRDVQRTVFEKQLRLGSATGKPIVIHSREAEEDTLEIMKKVLPDGYPIHLHCFTGSKEFAERMLAAFSGLRIGLTGTLTFKNASHLHEVAGRVIPFNRLLMETDGPFMAPVPLRGTVSHSGLIPTIASAVAESRREFGLDPNATVDSVLRETYAATRELYKL